MVLKKTSKNKFKRAICLFLIAILNINTFGAIVSDNDGSAFITKAEFDALKSSFQAQIDEYNTSIDSKIDGAIAAYLAGIKLAVSTEENFFDGNGQDVFIGNISYIDNLKHGRPELSYNIIGGYLGNASQTVAQLFMNRETEIDRDYFESFFCDDVNDKFLYFSKKQQFKININSFSLLAMTWLSYTNTSDTLKIRWHGCYNGTPTGLSEDESNFAITDYSKRISDYMYMRITATMTNFGFILRSSTDIGSVGSSVTGSIYSYKTSIDDLIEEKNKIKYMMIDDVATNNNIWCLTSNTFSPNRWYADNTKAPYDTSVSNSYTTPSYANIDSSIIGRYIPDSDDDFYSQYNLKNVQWVTNGTWQYTEQQATDTSLPWYEPHPTLSTYDHTNLVHDAISEDMLIDYAPYEWKGKLTEGLPIAIFDQDTTVEFTIDTTEFGSDLVFAFSTEPFNPTVNRIYNQSEDEKLTITIDKNEVEGSGQAVVTPDVHNVKVELKTDEKTPIFFKMGLPENVADTSLRGIVKFPKTFLKTIKS